MLFGCACSSLRGFSSVCPRLFATLAYVCLYDCGVRNSRLYAYVVRVHYVLFGLGMEYIKRTKVITTVRRIFIILPTIRYSMRPVILKKHRQMCII